MKLPDLVLKWKIKSVDQIYETCESDDSFICLSWSYDMSHLVYSYIKPEIKIPLDWKASSFWSAYISNNCIAYAKLPKINAKLLEPKIEDIKFEQ
jgi:hypothetical protein